jgi:hypothetical protein
MLHAGDWEGRAYRSCTSGSVHATRNHALATPTEARMTKAAKGDGNIMLLENWKRE